MFRTICTCLSGQLEARMLADRCSLRSQELHVGSNYSNRTRSFGLNNLSREHLIIAVIPLLNELESLGE